MSKQILSEGNTGYSVSLPRKDMDYLSSVSNASGEAGKKIYNQIRSLEAMALPAWGAKNMVVVNPGENRYVGNHLGGFQFDAKGLEYNGRIIIYAMPDDTYTILFGKLKGTNFKVDQKQDGVVVYNLVKAINSVVR